MRDSVERLLDLYPRIFLACHVRHVRDPRTKELVTGNQVEILDHLSAAGSLGLKELAGHMGVTPATMSVSVDRLVTLGYVTRAPSEIDRRRVELSLTEQGRSIVDEHSVLDPVRVHQMLAELEEPEREVALNGLGKLAEAADRLMAKVGSGWSYLKEEKEEGEGK